MNEQIFKFEYNFPDKREILDFIIVYSEKNQVKDLKYLKQKTLIKWIKRH